MYNICIYIYLIFGVILYIFLLKVTFYVLLYIICMYPIKSSVIFTHNSVKYIIISIYQR